MGLIETALGIALRAYSGKTDKAGKEYILHPLRVMAKMATEEEMAVAILHDVIEDADVRVTDLAQAGIPWQVIEAVVSLSRSAGEPYEAFIQRVRRNPLATRVKLADIEDNINVLRLVTLSAHDLARVAKYHAAWQALSPSPSTKEIAE